MSVMTSDIRGTTLVLPSAWLKKAIADALAGVCAKNELKMDVAGSLIIQSSEHNYAAVFVTDAKWAAGTWVRCYCPEHISTALSFDRARDLLAVLPGDDTPVIVFTYDSRVVFGQTEFYYHSQPTPSPGILHLFETEWHPLFSFDARQLKAKLMTPDMRRVPWRKKWHTTTKGKSRERKDTLPVRLTILHDNLNGWLDLEPHPGSLASVDFPAHTLPVDFTNCRTVTSDLARFNLRRDYLLNLAKVFNPRGRKGQTIMSCDEGGDIVRFTSPDKPGFMVALKTFTP